MPFELLDPLLTNPGPDTAGIVMLMETFICSGALEVGEREVAAAHSRRLDQTNTEYRQRIKALRKRLVVDKICVVYNAYNV